LRRVAASRPKALAMVAYHQRVQPSPKCAHRLRSGQASNLRSKNLLLRRTGCSGQPFGPTSTFPSLYSKAHSMAHRAKQPWRRISPTAAGRIQCPFLVPHKKELTVSQAVSPLNALFVWFLFDEAFHVGAGVCVVSLWFCVRPAIANARRMAAT